MKYKMVLHNSDKVHISLVDENYYSLVWIYSEYDSIKNDPDWPGGFWFNPNWSSHDAATLANKDYHEHRDEYIAEAKKLLIKEML